MEQALRILKRYKFQVGDCRMGLTVDEENHDL
jgi:hypothetical protein